MALKLTAECKGETVRDLKKALAHINRQINNNWCGVDAKETRSFTYKISDETESKD